MVQRKAAAKYLDMIVASGLMEKIKIGRTNYYMNTKLIELFVNHVTILNSDIESIESVHE